MRALVVDDDPSIRGMLEFLLASEDIDVVLASDGREALLQARYEHPDVILLDVMMPEIDGYGVLERLRADPELKKIPVIMLTARASDQDVWEGWRVGADSYLTKPIDIPELFKEIHRVTTERLAVAG
jgi:DNA-binding response OmpR family regulator